MSELLPEPVTFELQEGKPVNVEPGSALLGFEGPGECLVEQADPDVNVGSASCPRRCDSCGTTGYIEAGVYYSTFAPGEVGAPFCGRYQKDPVSVDLLPRPRAEQVSPAHSDEELRALARAAGLGAIEPVPRKRFAADALQAA
jgi:hypothetical protein